MGNQSDDDWQRTFALLQLEYKQAAERYENIYKAIWQIFSYMGLLAGGILTFGSRNSSFPIIAIVSIALTPLVFWFLAIYIPMNHYGEKARKHLADIEENFNKITEDFLDTPWELKHYKNFDSRKNKSNSSKVHSDSQKVKFPWRVKEAVCVSGVIIIIIAWFYYLYSTFNYYTYLAPKSTSEKIEVKLEPVEVTIQKLQFQELSRWAELNEQCSRLGVLYSNNIGFAGFTFIYAHLLRK